MQPAETSASPAPTTVESRPAAIRLAYHAILGVAAGFVSVFTALAWPFAIAVGIVIGKADVDQRRGVSVPGSLRTIRILGVTGGVLAMFVFGAFLGGIIAFFVAAIAAQSEKLAGAAPDADRGVARILFAIAAIATWLLLLFVLRVNIDIRIGG